MMIRIEDQDFVAMSGSADHRNIQTVSGIS